MKTSELQGPALDWAVTQCEGTRKDIDFAWWTEEYSPSTDWSQGGPIIEREGITVRRYTDALWDASMGRLNYVADGPTPLIAAMRCYVASKLGDEVEVPDEIVS